MPRLCRGHFRAPRAEASDIPESAHLTHLSAVAMAANQAVGQHIEIIAYPEKERRIFKYNCFLFFS